MVVAAASRERGAQAACAGGAYGVTLYDWMWRDDGGGLALGHGADLVVYAALFGLTGGGAGVYDRPCSELARRLGYSRETVQRSLTRLLALDVVWSPGGRAQTGGVPRAYAISPGPLERACGAAPAQPQDTGGPVGSPIVRDARDASPQASPACAVPSQAASACGAASRGGAACGVPSQAARACDDAPQAAPAGRAVPPQAPGTLVAPSQADPHTSGPSSQAPGTTCDEGRPARDGASRAAGDAPSRPSCDVTAPRTARHTPGTQAPPAQMALFDAAPVPPSHSSPDTHDEPGERRPLTPAERAAFEALVARSLLPVDDAFLGRDLEAFERIVASGVPADAVVEAYDDYAAYQHDRMRRTGAWRPMHLLHWLEMSPNGNIAYVMRRREAEAARASAGFDTAGAGPCRPQAGESPRRRGPRLTLCRDRGRAVWFVDDDHGSRRVVGAEGVEDLAEATRVYERMYQQECRDAWRVA